MARFTRLFLFTLCIFLTTTINSLDPSTTTTPPPQQFHDQQEMMQLMLEDAMSQLSDMGFSILSQAMKDNNAELAALSNITFFGLDDAAILSGSQAYTDRVLLHTVPNHFLTKTDLQRLPVGTLLPTLERGQLLEVTSGGIGTVALRINDVGMKVPNVIVINDYIVVHSVCWPFPRTHPTAAFVYHGVVEGPYAALEELGGCDV